MRLFGYCNTQLMGGVTNLLVITGKQHRQLGINTFLDRD